MTTYVVTRIGGEILYVGTNAEAAVTAADVFYKAGNMATMPPAPEGVYAFQEIPGTQVAVVIEASSCPGCGLTLVDGECPNVA